MISEVSFEIQTITQMVSDMSDTNSKWVFDPTAEVLDHLPYPWGHAMMEREDRGANDH